MDWEGLEGQRIKRAKGRGRDKNRGDDLSFERHRESLNLKQESMIEVENETEELEEGELIRPRGWKWKRHLSH